MKNKLYLPISIGMISGITLGLLMAPKSGKDLRRDLDKILNKMGFNNMKDDFTMKVNEILNDLKKIDSEDILEEVKKQVKKTSKKIEKLTDSISSNNCIKDLGNMMNSTLNSFN